jgi:twitching motility protein PilT
MGRVAAFEVMIATPSVRSLIREGKTHQLHMDIQTGAQHGMESLDSNLFKLVKKGLVKYEDALGKTSNPAEFATRARTLKAAAAAG